MKLLLTSAGLSTEKIRKEFLDLISKKAEEIKVIMFSYFEEDDIVIKYIDLSIKHLEDIGLLPQNIELIKINNDQKIGSLERFDVVYVCGGNTFVILDRLRKLDLDEKIKDFVKKGKLYLGVSAGSIIAGPDIEIAGYDSNWDKNIIGLDNLKGFELTNISISPHYVEAEKEIVEKFRKKVDFQVLELTDEQALLITDKETKII